MKRRTVARTGVGLFIVAAFGSLLLTETQPGHAALVPYCPKPAHCDDESYREIGETPAQCQVRYDTYCPPPAPSKKKAKKKAKGYDYENSRYKAYKELVGEPKTYRFDERGNPIPPPDAKKKQAGKKKKKILSDEAAVSPEDSDPASPTGDSGDAPAAENCAEGESCGAGAAKAEKAE